MENPVSLHAPELPNQPALEDVAPLIEQPEPKPVVEVLEPSDQQQDVEAATPDPTPPAAAVSEPLPTVAQAAPPTASSTNPAMPGVALPGAALPGSDDDDDDYEMPDDVVYDAIIHAAPSAPAQRESAAPGVITGTVVGLRDDGVFVDINRKSEAFMEIKHGDDDAEPLKLGDKLEVTISGTSPQGYLLLQNLKAQRPKGWAQLEVAFASGGNIVGKVTEMIKGGLAVEVGVRAFLPGSRSGERTDEGLQALVGKEIQARIVQLDEEDRNVVLDRRVILDEERASQRIKTLAGMGPGDTVHGIVRNLRKFGAFVDLGGVDGLLHVSDMAWHRVNDPADILSEGQELEVKILKIEDDGKRISVGLKQLQPDPWTLIADKLHPGDRITGAVTRLKEFGAFVEVEPGIDGLVHVSEMSWNKRVRHPSEILNVGDIVEVSVLDVKIAEKRISLGLKQALGDPWERLEGDFPVGTAVNGTVRKIASFGAFVEIFAGMDGLLHISDITSEKRLNSPSEMLREGQEVRVKVLEIDRAQRRLKLGMKQLEPTEIDSFMSEVVVGDKVTGRVVKVRDSVAVIGIGEGVTALCQLKPDEGSAETATSGPAVDLSSMTSMLEAAWKGGGASAATASEAMAVGSIHTFTITKLDTEKGAIELAEV
jgi:small subunit ribosomal protein S1